MNNPGQSRFAPRSKQFISKSDPDTEADQSSPEARRISYHRSSARGTPSSAPLPPIAHRRSSPAISSHKHMNHIKSKRSDSGLSNDMTPSNSPEPNNVQAKTTKHGVLETPPSNQYNRTVQTEPRCLESSEKFSTYVDRAAYSAGEIQTLNKSSFVENSNRRRTSHSIAKNRNSISVREEGRLTSDEYEYEYEYEYERGPRNFRRLKPRYRNSSVKSRKAKNSPVTIINAKEMNSRRSRSSASHYNINTVSSSESNSGMDFSDNLVSAEDGSPLSSRSLFNSEPNSSRMDTMRKKKYSSSPHKIWNSLRARHRYFMEQTYTTVFVMFAIAGCVTFSTFYTLAPKTVLISNNQHSVDSSPFVMSSPMAKHSKDLRKIAQNRVEHPRIVLLSDIHSHLAPSLTPTNQNIRANPYLSTTQSGKFQAKEGRKVELYPTEFSDNTQFYGEFDSADPKLSHMELREPEVQGECVPMAEWQTTFHPSCNSLHEYDLRDANEKATLFGKKGYWRHAWHLEQHHEQKDEHFVLKTLKYEHNFEDAHFEHDRVDAVAMEMLTSSPHVINIFGFCGHSVVTEYADQPRIGTLADKNKKNPIKMLEIARDIANGIADVHAMGKNGDESLPNAFVHLDVNPANVVSVGGTLKLNDFNIGIMRKLNTTSKEPCGFPAQYPNPQWRSPEEAWESQNLNEKVDVYSMGHIFFRLICGHEPWNKLEPKGKPTKELIEKKVKKHGLPFIPDSVKKSDNPATKAIYKVILKCYRFKPENRPSAREIAKEIDRALQQLLVEENEANTKTK